MLEDQDKTFVYMGPLRSLKCTVTGSFAVSPVSSVGRA